MRENATFFNARRRIRKPVAPSTRLQALRACQNPSVGAELAPNRRPYGECGINCKAADSSSFYSLMAIVARVVLERELIEIGDDDVGAMF
jgi:hypothetical protein